MTDNNGTSSVNGDYKLEIAHERELRLQWQDAHERFHTIDKEALVLAKREVDRRLGEMNQFRAQIEIERGDFLRRDMYDAQHNTLETELDIRFNTLRNETDTRLKVLETSKSNLEGRMWAIGAVITALAVGLNLLLHYLR